MGTRADFYVGRRIGHMKWIGSIALDGYPSGIPRKILLAKTAEQFRSEVNKFLKHEDSATLPEHGWPWLWDTSANTDFAYCFDKGKVLASYFGGDWFKPLSKKIPEGPLFPQMASKRISPPDLGSLQSGVSLLTIKDYKD